MSDRRENPPGCRPNTIASEAIATDTGITREEFGMMKQYRKAMLKLLFDTWDEDGSGSLDIAEMVKAVRASVRV